MNECKNPDCLCHDVDPQDFRRVSNDHVDQRFGMALSRLKQAGEDLAFLVDFNVGQTEVMMEALADIARAREKLGIEHRQEARTRGFTIRGGIGPGDWERK